MDVGTGTDDCSEFLALVDYDPWIVPHQVLPAIAVLIGINWKEVVIIMYMWESFEVLLFNCMKVSSREHAANSLLSDPIQCFIGIIVASVMMKFTKTSPILEVEKRNFIEKYVWGCLFIIPGSPIIAGGDYVWIYIPLVLFFIYSFSVLTMADKRIINYMIIYSLIISISVFSLKDTFNSFYVGVLGAVSTIILTVLINIYIT